MAYREPSPTPTTIAVGHAPDQIQCFPAQTIDASIQRFYQQEEDCIRVSEELSAINRSTQTSPHIVDDEELQAVINKRSDLLRRLETSTTALGGLRAACARQGYDVDRLDFRRSVYQTVTGGDNGEHVSSWMQNVPASQDSGSRPVDPNVLESYAPPSAPSSDMTRSAAQLSTSAAYTLPSYQAVEASLGSSKFDIVEDGLIMLPSILARRNPRWLQLYETLEPRRDPGTYFTVGKVFMTLWSEPEDKSSSTALDDQDSFVGKYGERVSSILRTFIVIWEGQNHSLALPVVKYGGLGVAAKAATKSDHGIVFTSTQEPRAQPDELPVGGESPMLSWAIRVVTDRPYEKLPPMSRINYGKLYTISHGLGVRHFGSVHPSMLPALIMNWRTVLQGQQIAAAGLGGNTLVPLDAQSESSISSGPSSTNFPSSVQESLLTRASSIMSVQANNPPLRVQDLELGRTLDAMPNPASPDRLESTYRRRPPKYFKRGRVFWMLHTEPDDDSRSIASFPGKFGEKLSSKKQLFVAIRESASYCLVLPVVDVKPGRNTAMETSEQGRIFTGRKFPETKSEDQVLQANAIRVVPGIPSDKLRDNARIHYGRIYTVDLHVKIKDFGIVHNDSLGPLLQQALDVFQAGTKIAGSTPRPGK